MDITFITNWLKKHSISVRCNHGDLNRKSLEASETADFQRLLIRFFSVVQVSSPVAHLEGKVRGQMGNRSLTRSRSKEDNLRHTRNNQSRTNSRSYSFGQQCTRNAYQECLLRRPIHNECVTALAAARADMVVSGGKDNVVCLMNYETGECLKKWTGHARDITKVAYGERGSKPQIFSASRDGMVILWKFDENSVQRMFAGHELSVAGLAPSDDCAFLCTGSRDNTVRLWDVERGKTLATQHLAQNLVTHVCWRSSVSYLIAQSSEDKELKLWDSRDMSLVFSFPKKQYIQMYCDISMDGQYCLTCSNGFNSNGCELTLWDIRQRKMIREYVGHQQSTNCAVFLYQKESYKPMLLSVSTDHTVRLWNMEDGRLLWTEYVVSGGSLLAAANCDNGIIIGGQNGCLCHLVLQTEHDKVFLRNRSMQVHTPPHGMGM